MVGTHSTEARIDAYLRHLQCSGESFIGIVRNLGITISSGQLSEVLRGRRKPFDRETGNRLLEILGRMQELQESVAPIPIAWNRSEMVATALTLRLIAANEVPENQKRFELLADEAAEALR